MSGKTKRTLATYACFFNRVLILGVVGGMEQFAIPVGRGIASILGLLILEFVLLCKAGAFEME